MKSVPKIVSTVLSTALIFIILISAAQWVAYENAEEKVLSLPCNLSTTPYLTEVESFLPPDELIERGIGHRYGDGELEVVVPGKLGGMDPYYEYLPRHLSWELNDSIAYLRSFLANGSDGEVKMAFQVVERSYFMFRFEERLCRKNLTAVVFRPSPPLKWLLSLSSALKELGEDEGLRAMLFGTAVAFIIVGIFWLWLFLVAKIPLKGPLKMAASLLLMVILFGSAVPALKLINIHGENGDPAHRLPKCDVAYAESCRSLLFHAALDYMGDKGQKATCEVLNYLSNRLSQEEMEKLVGALSPDCPELGF
ncbi:hypothetical protein [Thermococcus sp. 21S7]|uniref:hypothetical protein n=1 Tax=Thermococcus sp. 21S7 TaxID=1638221 RepID=UPI00143C8C03|nr:hypothetical protein [Thermococcus sp. 21S7]NJE61467.1 hypothetical protein [Thermococcus sp. 21S7]